MTDEKHNEVRRRALPSITGSGKHMTKMKNSIAAAGLAAAAAMGMSLTFAGTASAELVGPSCTAYAEKVPTGPGSVAGMAMDPVAVAASNNPMLTTLTKGVSGQLNPNVNLVDTLNGGEFTVFAPTDDAFAKLDPATIEKLKTDSDLLTSILTYHVVSGQMSPAQIVGTHKTVQGADLTVTGMGNNLKVNGASVVCGGVATANAQVYMIDTVLLPPMN
jgi:uncharacterized surface protein with fasciclin (FAS1) repeats